MNQLLPRAMPLMPQGVILPPDDAPSFATIKDWLEKFKEASAGAEKQQLGHNLADGFTKLQAYCHPTSPYAEAFRQQLEQHKEEMTRLELFRSNAILTENESAKIAEAVTAVLFGKLKKLGWSVPESISAAITKHVIENIAPSTAKDFATWQNFQGKIVGKRIYYKQASGDQTSLEFSGDYYLKVFSYDTIEALTKAMSGSMATLEEHILNQSGEPERQRLADMKMAWLLLRAEMGTGLAEQLAQAGISPPELYSGLQRQNQSPLTLGRLKIPGAG